MALPGFASAAAAARHQVVAGSGLRPAVFLDRDGVINRTIVREGKPHAPVSMDELEIIPGTAEALLRMRSAGLLCIVVTNQPDLARAQLDWRELGRMHRQLRRWVRVDALLLCPHDDGDHCVCRKPLPGMLTRASRAFGLELRQSFMIGDSPKDIAAGRAAGCRTILIEYNYDEILRQAPDFRVASLLEAADLILR